MNKKMIVPATLTLAGALMLSGCGDTDTVKEVMDVDVVKTKPVVEEFQVIEDSTVICDENGNKYASEQEAKAAGLLEAQYGATYCQYFDEEGNDIEKDAAIKTDAKATQEEVVKEAVEVVPTEKFSKKEQVTGSKKHDDFILEHVKHNDAGDKYVVTFKLDRKHDAKTHVAPYTVATYHAHDSKHNNGRIEVEIHEIDKNKFDVGKVIKPKHNKYVKDIVMEETDNDTRAKFTIHLDEKAIGKFNLSSDVVNNQDATVTLNILE